MHLFIFIWVFLNFLGIVIENVIKSNSNYFYNNILNNSLNPQNKRRLECALATFLLIVSSLSSFYFFAGEEIGNIFVYRIFQGNFIYNITKF